MASTVGVTTVSATPETGGSAIISPADSDTVADGHQVALDDGLNVIMVTATKPGAIPTTYLILLARDERVQAKVTDISFISTPLQRETYGKGETVIAQVMFDNTVQVNTADGRPKLTAEVDWINGQIFLSVGDRRFKYVRGSGTDALEFEYVVRAGDYIYSNRHLKIRVERDQLKLNGGAISHAGNGRPATLTHNPTGIISGHKLRGDLTRPIAKLGGLALSDLTLSPEFDSNTTIYTAEAAANIAVSTITPVLNDGTSISGQPDDSDTTTSGYQVALSEGINEISIAVNQADSAPRNYTIAVNRLPGPPEVAGIAIVSDPGSEGT